MGTISSRQSYVIAVVLAAKKTRPADQSADYVRHDAAVQIGHYHHVELMGFGNQLHTTIIDDHVVVFDVRIFLSNRPRCFQKQSV